MTGHGTSWVGEADAHCPHCGEPVVLTLDPLGGRLQRYVEDCPVCCRPWDVSVRFGDRGDVAVVVDPA